MLPVLSQAKTHHQHHLENNNNQHNSTPRNQSTKRNASMIFRIEHLLPPTTHASNSLPNSIQEMEGTLKIEAPSTSVMLTKRESRSVDNATQHIKHSRSGVYVSQFIPKDTLSQVLPTLELMSSSYIRDPQHLSHIYCTFTAGVISMTPSILRKIKLSEDIHSYNAIFELHNGNVRVRVVRDIMQDDELIVWFGEEITLLMSIPFLTPLNIQGNNRYTCHLCHLTFETPNPLKIHLALGCGRHSMDILWIRLHYAIKATTYTAVPITVASQLLPSPSPPRCGTLMSSPKQHRFSAFRPITSSTVSSISTTTTTPASLPLPTLYANVTETTSSTAIAPRTTTNAPMPYVPTISATAIPSVSLMQATGSSPLNAAAQIEAIVSNMGASKQGHLCIYCGKVYSRKYGLKIHIRTHTGFKPLQCKFCMRPFGDPSNLNKHVRLHLQSSSSAGATEGYNCHLCQKTLARRRDLQRHIESRHSNTSSTHITQKKNNILEH